MRLPSAALPGGHNPQREPSTEPDPFRPRRNCRGLVAVPPPAGRAVPTPPAHQRRAGLVRTADATATISVLATTGAQVTARATAPSSRQQSW